MDCAYPQMVVNSLTEMEVATAAELTPAVGNLMNLMLGGGGGPGQQHWEQDHCGPLCWGGRHR